MTERVRTDTERWIRTSAKEDWWDAASDCRIHEHDGAFKCYTHDRLWGAVPDPDEPCEPAESEGETYPTAAEPDA